jgi:O-antigen ligase
MNLHTIAAWVAALFLASSVFAQNVALRLLLLAAGIVLTGLVAHRYRDSVRALPPIWLPFLLWGGWALLSLIWSLEPERTLKEWRNEVFYTGAALWICYVGAQATRAVRIFLIVAGLAAALACGLALRDFMSEWRQYLEGWHGGPGDHSSALLTLLPCVLLTGWYAFHAGWRFELRLLPWALLVLLLVSAYATLNRAIWIALIVQLVLIQLLLTYRERRQVASGGAPRANFLPALKLLAIVAVGLTMIFHVHAKRTAMADVPPLAGDARWEVWTKVAQRVAERPLTGHGFGRGIRAQSIRDQLGGDGNLWHAHNLPLDTALQTGVPGLALLLAVLGATLLYGWRFARSLEPATAACGIALIGVVAGMLARNMTDTLLVRQNALLYWSVIGVLLAWGGKPWRTSS